MTTLAASASSDRTGAQQVRSREAERRLLEAAIWLIGEQGYERTSLAQVAARAGYSHGQTARRFGTKAALLTAVIDALLGGWHEDVVAPAVSDAAQRGGVEAVLAVVDAYATLLAEHPRQLAAVQQLFFESLRTDARLTERVRVLHIRLREHMADHVRTAVAAGGVRADIDPDATATIFVSALRGAGFQWLLDPHGFDLAAALKQLCRHITLVLAPPDSASASADAPTGGAS